MSNKFSRRSDRVLAGVCSTIADYCNISPAIIRILAVIGCFVIPGAVIGFYIFVAFLMLLGSLMDRLTDR